MKRSLAILLALLLMLNASPAVLAEEGIAEELSSGQDNLPTEEAAVLLSDSVEVEEGVVEEPEGEVTEIRVSDFAGLKAALSNELTADTVVILTADIEGISEQTFLPDSGAYRLILDMNSHTITTAENFSQPVIINRGKLTVTGNGYFEVTESTDNSKHAMIIDNEAECVIESGEFISYAQRPVIANHGGMLRINGGSIVGTRHYGIESDGGRLVIDDGYFEGFYAVFCDGSNMEINGGEFVGNDNGQPAIDVRGGANVTINGGSFESPHGAIGIADGNSFVEINDGTFRSTEDQWVFVGNLDGYTLYGGSYEGNGADYGFLADRLGYRVAEGATVYFNNEEYTVEPIPEGDVLNTSDNIFGTGPWAGNEDCSFEKAFDGDVLTYYDAYDTIEDANVGIALDTPTRLTKVSIYPRSARGYDVGVQVLDSYSGFNSEGAENLFRYDLNSKWCGEFMTAGTPDAPYVVWRTDEPMEVIGYEIYTGSDTGAFPGRNPTAWTLYGRASEEDEWTVIDQQSENYDLPAADKAGYTVHCAIVSEDENGDPIEMPHPEYQYFMLTIDEIVGNDRDVFQIGGFRLLECGDVENRMEGMTVQGSAGGNSWVDLYTFPGQEFYHTAEYVVGAKEMDLVNDYSFTQFRVVNKDQHFNVAEVEFYGLEDSELPLYEYEEEILPDGELNLLDIGETFGTGSWAENIESTYDKAFDGDWETVYDAYAATYDAHVGIAVNDTVQLTAVNIIPRMVNGYDPDMIVWDASFGYGGEEALNLFDCTADSKWCYLFDENEETYVIWETTEPIAVCGYQMYTANDNAEYPGRNPISWTLYGSTDGQDWQVIDEQIDNYDIPDGDKELYEVLFTGTDENGEPVYYPTAEYSYFKLTIEDVEKYFIDGEQVEEAIFQLGEFRLLNTVGELLRMEGMTVQGSSDGVLWADLYTFPNDECYYAQDYFISADDMDYAGDYSFTQFRVINKQQHFNVAEVEFYGRYAPEMEAYPSAPEGEHNLLDYGEAFGSDSWDEYTIFTNAFDGDPDTCYDAYDNSFRDAEIGITLGTPAKLTGFRVHPRGDWTVERLRNLTVQGSVNGEDWITLYQFPEVVDYEIKWYEISEDMLASAAQEYAFTQFRVMNKSEHLNVADIEFYGTYEHDLETFPTVIDEPIYSYLTAEQFLNSPYVHYERDPENPDDDHYLDYWYFNDLDEDGMSRFEREFEGREPIILIGGVGFDDTVMDIQYIDGKPVAVVGPWAFVGEEEIVEVVIGEDSECKYLLTDSFAECENLTSVTVSNSLRDVVGSAFRYCPSLGEFIKVGGDLSEEEKQERDYGYVDVVDDVLTARGDWLIAYPAAKEYVDSYHIPDVIRYINDWAFNGAKIGEITMGHNVVGVYHGAFADSTAHTIKLSPSLRFLSNDVFAGCTNLTYVSIPSGKVKIEWWENGETGEIEYNEWLFGGTEQEIVVRTYAGNMIDDYINYIHDLSAEREDYDMYHIVFEEETETYWYGFDWWGECGENEVFLVGYSAPLDAEITTMPNVTYDGKDIIGIIVDGEAWTAFHDDERVGGDDGVFTIPEGIRYIYDAPFRGCENLKTIEIPASMEYMGLPFADCHALEQFVVAEGSEYCETSNGGATLYCYEGDEYLLKAFALASGMQDITVAEGTDVICDAVFEHADIQSVTLPESLSAIDCHVFKYSTLESITIPENVNRIMEYAFAYCQNLTDVYIERKTGEFCAWEDRDFTTVFEGSENVTVYVYAGTDAHRAADEYGWTYEVMAMEETVYDTYVANDGVHLRSVLAKPGDTYFTIPEEVMIIDNCAFAGIEGIETVVFPKDLRYIGHEAFAGCGEFEIVFSGAVPIYWEDSAFDEDFNVEELYNIAFYWNQAWDGEFLYYVAPDAKEAMVRGYWYTAIDENGVMEVPATLEWDGETYTVTAIEPNACRPDSPEGIYNHLTGEAGGLKWEIEERDEWAYEYPKHIVLPETIRYIGDGAFSDQTYDHDRGSETQYGLTSVKLPASVQYIDSFFVWGCWDIEEYTGLDDINDENSSNPYRLAYGWNEYGEEVGVIVNTWNEIVLHAYPQGRSDSEFITPAGIEVIGISSFRDAYALNRVNLTEGDSVRRIENEAFASCENLERVMISTNLEHIEHAPFQGCYSLTTFDIPYGSNYFSMHGDGTLRMDDGATIAVIPLGNIPEDGVLRISDDVWDIKDGAAVSSDRLTELIIPASVKNIYDCAFADCWNLREVKIEGTLDYLHINTFRWCQNLEIIVYGGETLNIHYYRGDDEYIRVERDGDNNVIWNEDGTANRIPFDILCLNPECEVNFFIVDNYDYENGDREYLDVYNNDFFNLQVGAPYYELYTAEDGVHLAKVYNVSGIVEIPEDVMVIDDYAFEGIEITSVEFPETLYYIGYGAFAGCGDFEVSFRGAVELTIADGAFDEEFDMNRIHSIHYPEVYADVENGLFYRLNPATDEAMVNAWYYNAVDENGVLAIPETITADGNEYTVVAIEREALASYIPDIVRENAETFVIPEVEWNYPTSIVLPETIRYIGDNAFAGHGYWNEEEEHDFGLESITLPASVLYIGHDAFWDSYQIREFNGLEPFGESENPYQIFDGSIISTWGDQDVLMAYPVESGRTEYIVSGDIEIIGDNAFRWAEELAVLEFEEGVRVLRGGAVVLTGLETLYLPDSLEDLQGHSLSYNHHMQNFIVSENHPWLTVHEDGTLRSEDGERLIAYPTANIGDDRVLEITAESGIKRISNVAVAGINIRKLILSEEVEHIDDWAFENNDDLRIAVIHGTIDTMNIDVFADCDNMEAIVYYGEYINVYYYEGDNFTVAHAFDDYGTPRKIDFIMPGNADSITFSVAMNYDFEDRVYDIYYPNDNPFFDLHSEHIPFILYDVDGDRTVTEEDALYMLRYTILPERYPMYHVLDWNFDGSEDGMITAADAAALKNIMNQ